MKFQACILPAAAGIFLHFFRFHSWRLKQGKNSKYTDQRYLVLNLVYLVHSVMFPCKNNCHMEIKKLKCAPLLLTAVVRAIPHIFLIFGVMMKKSLIAALFLASASSVLASEISPVLEKQSCEKPAYPKASLMNEESGTVVFSVLVGPDGNVMDSKIDKSSGPKLWIRRP